MKSASLLRVAGATALLALSATANAADPVKNVILMISDGQGFNTVKATEYYTGGQASYESWATKFGMNTSSAGSAGGYVGAPYNPTAMWSNFNYQKSGATDSASAATAMFTGVKNYDNQINKTTSGANLTTFFEHAANAGKSTGAVSTVNFDHATPAAVAAHTTNRNDYTTIASQMVNSRLDVVMGAGNPNYNNNGQAVTPNYGIVGNQTNWNSITGGANGRTYIESKQQFQDLANGTLSANKVFGVAQVKDTLQDSRSGTTFNTNVPTLATMTQGALNVLDNNTNGFAVMIEGGAIDWANHANQLKRSIDEQIDFNNAVDAVYAYLTANGGAGTNGNSLANTLLIVTADHETGGLWGAKDSFTQVGDNGVGNLPTAVFNSGSHTTGLVPLYAIGAGSELFDQFVMGTDSQVAGMYGVDSDFNQYIDNTAIYQVMSGVTAIPEPSTYAAIFGMLSLGFAMFRRVRR